MSYALFDDRWDEHPKYASLELEHMGLMACALVYCNRQLTDGFVPEKAVRGWGASGKGLRYALTLVSRGIWRPTDGGFEVVGYLDHNPSRAAVLERRELRARAGKLGGSRSGARRSQASAEAGAQASAVAVANTNVEPSPLLSSPILSDPKKKRERETRAKRAHRLPEGWRPSEQLLDDLRKKHGVEPLSALDDFLDWAASSRNAVKVDWDATFRGWVRRDAANGKLDPYEPPQEPLKAVMRAPPPPEALAVLRDLEAKSAGDEHVDVGENATAWRAGGQP